LLEHQRAERYPRTRWNFGWERYVVVGVPDGMTARFVYEFKTTKKRQYLPESRASAIAQADLYGYFFGRRTRRVQILIRDDERVETWQEPVDQENAVRVLRLFTSVDDGVRPSLPPEWKCRVCEFKDVCPLLESPDGWRTIV